MKTAKKLKHLLSSFTWYVLIICCIGVFLTLCLSEQGEAKKRKRAYSPVKVEKVVTSPDPFIIGQSPLKISMVVQLPTFLKGDKVLEVSALITSPTRRSINFIAHRLLLEEQALKKPFPTVPVDLVWDGKDQYDQYVADGAFFYEIQAKVMDDKGEGPRTKIISRRVQGTLKALAYVGEVLPPVAPESDLSEDSEITVEEESVEGDLPVLEEGLKEADDPTLPKEEDGNVGVELIQGIGEGVLVEPEQTDESVGQEPETLSEVRTPETTDDSIVKPSTSLEEMHSVR